MSDTRSCSRCGRPLAPGSILGLCPACVLAGMESGEPAEGPDDLLPFLNPQHGPAVPEAPGRYTGRREFARGGMGRILLARDECLGREIVIKELLGKAQGRFHAARPLQESTPAVARFLREARIAGQLEHPSIVPVHELGCREDGTLYYTMKHVRGVSLSQVIEQAPSLDERLKLLLHCCRLNHFPLLLFANTHNYFCQNTPSPTKCI